MTVDLNPARARLVNERLPELVAAARGQYHGGCGAPPDPAPEPAMPAVVPKTHVGWRPGSHDQAVAQLHSTGLSDAEISRRLGVTRHQVWETRRRLNLPSNGRGAANERQFTADVQRLWERGLCDAEIAEALTSYPNRVYKTRKRLGLAAQFNRTQQKEPA